MTIKNFKDFGKNQPSAENISVSDSGDFVVDPQNPDEDQIPALFATIHMVGPDRPDGHTDEDMFDLNHAANSHMPELQKQMVDDREAAGYDVSEYRPRN